MDYHFARLSLNLSIYTSMGYSNHLGDIFSGISLTIPWNHAATIFGDDFLDIHNRTYLVFVGRMTFEQKEQIDALLLPNRIGYDYVVAFGPH